MLKILPPTQIYMPNGLSIDGSDRKSIIKWQTRTDWQENKITAFKIEAIDTRKLYERDYQLDMHRWITKQIEPLPQAKSPAEAVNAFKEILRSFAEQWGDFFTNDVTANITEQSIADWMREWIQIGSWGSARDAANKLPFNENNPHPATWRTTAEKNITGKLNRYTSAEVVTRSSASSNQDIAIRPTSWAGWCWTLIARDFYDDITYKPCINFENCGREVPSLTLKGNPTNRCSEKCRKAAYRKRKAK
jgi:hypothetical protein